MATATERIDTIINAARERGDKVEQRDSRYHRRVDITVSLMHGLEVWSIVVEDGRVRARESFNGWAVSGRRIGQEIDLSHRVSLAEVERRFELR